MMDVQIRRTSEKEFVRTEYITREAFWNIYKPGCDEHLVLHNIRESKCYIAKLDIVAVFENEIIGHMISTKAKVVDPSDNEHEILCAGPLSVIPGFQGKGTGSKLMYASITAARESGYSGMILFGNPDYYRRFGFCNAKEYGIMTKEGLNFEPFMALELKSGGLAGITGRFFEDDAFTTHPGELIEFEKQFPFKEKQITETQLKFNE